MRYKIGTATMLVLTILCCSGWSTPEGCGNPQPAPSSGDGGIIAGAIVAVAAIGVGTAILVHVHHAHHNIKGCAVLGKDGLEILKDNDSTPFLLTGLTTTIKVGDEVHVHGDKISPPKGSEISSFKVDEVAKDLGPCKNPPADLTRPLTSITVDTSSPVAATTPQDPQILDDQDTATTTAADAAEPVAAQPPTPAEALAEPTSATN